MYFLLGAELFMSSGIDAVNLGRSGGMETVSTLTGRIPLWKTLMSAVHQRPLVGHGYDTFLIGENLIRVSDEVQGWIATSTHSGYMGTLLGLGYIGAVALVLILILSVTKSISLARRNPEYAFVAAVLVWLIFNLYTEDQILTRPLFPVFVWMIMLARLFFLEQKRR